MPVAQHPLQMALAAIKKNFLPGLVLQGLMGIFLAAYFWHEPTRFCFEKIAAIKQEAGFLFSATAYCVSSAILPEILKIFLSQKGKILAANLRSTATSAPIWAFAGILVDGLYRTQNFLFGTGNDIATVLSKIAFDQLVFSPFIGSFLIVAAFCWRDTDFRSFAFFEKGIIAFFLEKVFPVQVASWCVWPLAVAVIYSMPPAMQIPIAVLLQTFWVLVFTAVNRPSTSVPK